MPRVITKDIINERLADREIELIGEYLGSKIQTLFRCSHGNEWSIAPWYLLAGRTCSCMVNRLRMSKEQINELIAHTGITMIGKYKGTQKPSLFKCSEEHQFRITPSHILYSKRGCPMCAEYGFNQSKAAHTYILDFGFYIKYGITNDLSTRLDTHRRNNGDYTLVETREYSTGYEAKRWENEVKIKFGGRHVTKEQCPDGYTETLSPELLQELLAFTNKR